jgi:hypothetical protein
LAPCLPFLGKSAEYSAADFLDARIFKGPLLRFAAEISAGWEHCSNAVSLKAVGTISAASCMVTLEKKREKIGTVCG